MLALTLALVGCGETMPEPEVTRIVAPNDPDNTEPPVTETVAEPDPIGELIASMTLEEKVGQLIVCRAPSDPEQAIADIGEYHLGGYVLFASDFASRDPVSAALLIQEYQNASKLPLIIAVDEEGGTVVRVSKFSQYRKTPFASPRELLAAGGIDSVASDTKERCELLSSLGINLNLAPVADISTNKKDFIYYRSAGDLDAACEYVRTFVESSEGVGTALKHFPGYGGNADTHTGTAVDTRDYESFVNRDFLPFVAGIEAGADIVLVSHNTVNCMDSKRPASLSPEVHRVLREELGFDRLVMTDDLSMEAITKVYGAGEAAVLAFEAGNDIVCCSDPEIKYTALLKAAKDGRISTERLDESVRRILEFKAKLGLIEG